MQIPIHIPVYFKGLQIFSKAFWYNNLKNGSYMEKIYCFVTILLFMFIFLN